MFEIRYSEIKRHFSQGRVVAVEFENRSNIKSRAIVQGLSKNRCVKTLHGTVTPIKIYTAATLPEVMNWLNETPN